MLCTHKTTILCQFGLSCHQLTTISPSILNHFWWELYHKDLTETQQNSALRIINIIKEKWNGQLKGRSVADGRPQHAFYTKDETSSPTATPESVLLTAMVDAVEDQHVVVADVAGGYG